MSETASGRTPRDGRKPSKAWGTCRGCDEVRGLTKRATIRRHVVKPGGDRCDGSHQSPRYDMPVTLATLGFGNV